MCHVRAREFQADLFKQDKREELNLYFFTSFAEYGSAAGAGPVKK